MQDERREWYRKGLGPRIDALELALRGVMEKTPNALASVRRLAQTLSASSQSYEFPEIAAAATCPFIIACVHGGTMHDLPEQLRRHVLRAAEGDHEGTSMPCSGHQWFSDAAERRR